MWFLAFLGGVLLVLMMQCNSIIAQHSTPFFASWVIHGAGSVAALFLAMLFSRSSNATVKKEPFWSYFGGIPGALSVVLAAVSINSPLQLSGTFALMLVGQIILSVVCDLFGLFGTPKKRFVWRDGGIVFFVLVGSSIIIFF